MIIFITRQGKLYNKTRQLIYYKTGQGLLQNAAGITKRGKSYYETRQVLQNGAIITKRSNTTTYFPVPVRTINRTERALEF